MSADAADSTQADSAHSDELDEQQAAKRFSLSGYQLNKLPARRLSRSESRRLGNYRSRGVKLYRVSDLQALAEQVEKRRTGEQTEAARLPEPAEQKWDFTDTGFGNSDEIDELKIAEHYKLGAAKLRPLHCRKLRAEVQDSHGVMRWRSLKVYKLDDVFQIVTDLQKRLDEKHEAEADRQEQLQEARGAKAFEAASKARALVKTWKKPRLSPGQTCLPMELWGLVLGQLLSEDSLWDLPATVQELCSISMTSKGLYTAVQQQGWPKLCQLLSTLCPPAAVWQPEYLSSSSQAAQLPADGDILVMDPASLSLTDLRAACKYYDISATGIKAQVMVRILERFGLDCPCAAPMLVVAYSNIHAAVVLGAVHSIKAKTTLSYEQPDQRITASHASLCQQLCAQLDLPLPNSESSAWQLCRKYVRFEDSCMPAGVRSVANAAAAAAIAQLQGAFGSLKYFLQLAGCAESYDQLGFYE